MTERRAQEEIQEVLGRLRGLVEQAVREEQLIDRLTTLGNDEALNEWIQSNLHDNKPFWLAFIEVDRFKAVNDEFGYDAADELLRKVAEQLRSGVSYFDGPTTPFRAHGDEFFLGGVGDAEGVGDALEQIRRGISSLRVRPPDRRDAPGRMRCTVSVGWATDSDGKASAEVLGVRELRGALESAVAEAKNRRDCVVRFAPHMLKAAFRADRTDCGACRTKLDIRVPHADLRVGPLTCPNCGTELTRSPALLPPAGSAPRS